MYPGAEGSKRRGRKADKVAEKVTRMGLGEAGGGEPTVGGSEIRAESKVGRVSDVGAVGSVGKVGGVGDVGSMRLVEGALREPASEARSVGFPGDAEEDTATSWALQLLVDEVKRASATLDPNRAELLLQKIEARQRTGGRLATTRYGGPRRDRMRGWLSRVMHMLVFWAAAIAGSRAFRMLTL